MIFLKSQPVIFKRQKVIGNYIVDFFCAEAKLVIELDGSQHYNDAGKAADMVRDQYLKDKGLTVLRYSNLEIAEILQEFVQISETISADAPKAFPRSGEGARSAG